MAGIFDCRFDVADATVLVESAHQIERAVEFALHVGIELDARLEPPEQVRRDGDVSVFGQPVALAADAGVHPEDLLDHDNCRAWRSLGPRDIGGKCAIVREGGNLYASGHIGILISVNGRRCGAMKINIEIDCSPEEARQFMGLPDVEKANKVYVDTIAQAMKGVSNVDQLQDYAKQLAPMGQLGLKVFQSFVEGAAKSSGTKPKGDGDKSE